METSQRVVIDKIMSNAITGLPTTFDLAVCSYL